MKKNRVKNERVFVSIKINKWAIRQLVFNYIWTEKYFQTKNIHDIMKNVELTQFEKWCNSVMVFCQ